jgi:hypothetical protein
MFVRRRLVILLALVVLLPFGTRTQVEDYTAARRTCLTWASMRMSPYVVETPTEITRWLTEKVGTGAHSPVWWLEESSILGFQAYRHGPLPGRYRLRFLFWNYYQMAGAQEKEQVLATTRRYFEASDPDMRNAISAEAHKKWGHLSQAP